MASVLDFKQISTVLEAIVKQVTGSTTQAVVDTASFVAVANTALSTGYDQLNTAISQMVARTLYSERPYTAKFSGLRKDSIQWGNHVRKLNFVDKPTEDNKAYTLTDGESVDMYVVNKPKVIQTNFYGASTFSKSTSVTRKQLKTAFTGPEELQAFFANQMQNCANVLAQDVESLGRMTLANLIGGTIKNAQPTQVVNLITEYNAATGKNITGDDYRAPENYADFILWAYARIKSVSDMMTERTTQFHMNLTAGSFNRFTPYSDQQLFVLSSNANEIENRVFASLFHDQNARIGYTEKVNFWQSPDKPASVNVTASYMDATGAAKSDGTVEQDGVFAVLADSEAAGYSTFDEDMDATPFNARGKYTNWWWSYTRRWWNDNTENAVVFLLK